MSRLGKTPILVPKGVEIKTTKDGLISIKGPKGNLELKLPNGLHLKIEGQVAVIERDEKVSPESALHGLYRSLIKNHIQGVTDGFEIKLTMVGVGYRANVAGQKLDLSVGFSHPTAVAIPKSVSVVVDKGTAI